MFKFHVLNAYEQNFHNILYISKIIKHSTQTKNQYARKRAQLYLILWNKL